MNIELIKHGMAKHNTKEYAESIDAFTQAIKEDPFDLVNFQLYLLIGQAKFNLKDFHGSVSSYTNGFNFFEKNVKEFANGDEAQISSLLENAFRIRGNGRRELGDLDGAIQDYSGCISLNPNSSDAIYSRGVAYIETGNFVSAVNDFTKIIILNPKDALAYRNLGNAKFRIKDFSGAIADYSKAIDLSIPINYRSEVYNNRGIAYASKREFRSAILDFDKALEINPAYEQALNNRRDIQKELDKM